METQAEKGAFRSYLFFWSGQLVSLLGSSIAQFVIIWWITLETQSVLYLSIASFSGLMPLVILSPFAGVLADRWNRKVLIGSADFLQALVTVVLIFLFSSGLVSVWHVFVLLALRGMLQAFHRPAVEATTPLMVPRDKLSRMNGLNFLLSGAVTLVGPVTAAILLELWSIDQILWIDAGTFVVAVIPLLLITIPSLRKKQSASEEKLSFRREFGEGLTYIKNSRGLLTFIMLATALNFLLSPLSALFSYFIKYDHFGDAADFALVMALFQGGVFVGGVLMSVIKGFSRKMFATILSIHGIFIGYALLALTPTGLFWFMGITGFVAAFFLPIANVSIMTIRQTVVPLEMQGRVTSVMMALAQAALPVGIILSGVVAEFIGTVNLFLGCAMIGLLISAASWVTTDIKYVERIGEPSV